MKLSAGRVIFGTGDVIGYGVCFSLSKNIIKKAGPLMGRLLLGGELAFETGVKNPKVMNPSVEEFFSKTFNHISNTILFANVTYYPIRKGLFEGLNISVGPSIGYTFQSIERQASRIFISGLQIYIRQSYLDYLNSILIGYRISAGYEYVIRKRILIGFRLDFSSHTNGDINTLAGLKTGFTF